MGDGAAVASLEMHATDASLCGTAAGRRKALARLRPLLARVEHRHRAQCLTKRPIHALLDESSGEATIPSGDVVLRPRVLGTGEPYALVEPAAGVITTLLEDEHADVRLEALEALAELGACDASLAPRAAELLVDALTDDDARVRARALRRLAGVLDGGFALPREHARGLLASLGDGSATVRAAAARAAGRLTIAVDDDADADAGGGEAGALLSAALDALGACARREAATPDAVRRLVALVDAASSLGLRHARLLRPLLARARRERVAAGSDGADAPTAAPGGSGMLAAAVPNTQPATPAGGPPPPPLAPMSFARASAFPPPPAVAERALSLSALVHAAFAAAGALGADARRAAPPPASLPLPHGGASATTPPVRRSRSQRLPPQMACVRAADVGAARADAEAALAPLPAWVWLELRDVAPQMPAGVALGVPLSSDGEARAGAARASARRAFFELLGAQLDAWAEAVAAAAAARPGASAPLQPLALLPLALPPLLGAAPAERADGGWEDEGLGALRALYMAYVHALAAIGALHGALLQRTRGEARAEAVAAPTRAELDAARAAARAAGGARAALSALPTRTDSFLLWVGAWALGSALTAAALGTEACTQDERAPLAAELRPQLGAWRRLARTRAAAGDFDGREAAAFSALAAPLGALCDAVGERDAAAAPAARAHAAVLARAAQRALAEHVPRAPPPGRSPVLRAARVRARAADGSDAPARVAFVREGWPLLLELDVRLSGWDARSLEQCALVLRCARGGRCWRFALREADVVTRGRSALFLRACVEVGSAPNELLDGELELAVETSAHGGVHGSWVELRGGCVLPTAEYLPSTLLPHTHRAAA
ncbi:hypothetical protein KFE25_001327 [Diacronema lutheri]|uniref:Integrator complex subunit 4 n=1 Tax=Diacronema lutheri TaxID=2081491 RepID=A0A8J6C673_DIALT|nr:hypothetical protein KFE25_001327 [Diacronema lutheri]